ncbi:MULTISPECIES: AzlD domain-containing protein [Bacillaceae]|uniref:AzlD domain-containing protein n=1 Tax=Bacillaceae TaxID=186817 RepID=UPI002032EBF4|nr:MULTISPECIES: AzlD domain-containing protein [Bacillaceae]MDX8360991.1 AzlD domain-containing protein [Cytobacillus sp. IB215316]
MLSMIEMRFVDDMEILLIIIGMAIVTFIPRVIPAFVINFVTFPNWVNRWLSYIPYAALGALIFPGILTIQEDNIFIGLTGGIVAVLLSLLRLHILLVLSGSIIAVVIMLIMM